MKLLIERIVLVGVLIPLGAPWSDVSAQGELPYIPPELYQETRRIQGNSIDFCLWETNTTVELDRAVAEAAAEALLLDASFYRYDPIDMEEADFWPEVRILFAEHCSALAGVSLVGDAYPDWLVPTRSYYEAGFTFAVVNDEYESLRDIPYDGIIGSRLNTEGDHQFASYLASLPDDQKWRRFPYRSNEHLLEHLERGVVEAALFWIPQLMAVTDGNPEERGIRMLPLDPMQRVRRQVGFLVRQDQSFLRRSLDRAIEELISRGTIEELIEELGLPGSPPPLN